MTHSSHRRLIGALVGLGVTCTSITPAMAQISPPPPAQSDAQTEEIVVTAQRSGIPVWRVTGQRGTVVLVGTIRDVAAGTRWDPLPLEAALARADVVMFPDTTGFSLGLFSAIGALGKWRKQATLPKGQTLQALMSADQFARLVALRNRGVLKAGFERKHPYHLALTLRGVAAGKAGFGPDAGRYVRRTVKKKKLRMVPMAQGNSKAVMAEFFGSTARSHVPCLLEMVTTVETPGAIKARSDAWASRRVPDVMASVAERAHRKCWPTGSGFDAQRDAALGGTVRALLGRPQTTVAVISLDALAARGGVLDDLVSAGFDVRGPKWKL